MIAEGLYLSEAVFEISHVQWGEVDHALALAHLAALSVGLVPPGPQFVHAGVQSLPRPLGYRDGNPFG